MVRVKSDKSGVELNNVKMAMNPFCEIAVEQAIRLKESGLVDEFIVVTVGAAHSQETLIKLLLIFLRLDSFLLLKHLKEGKI